MLAPFDDFIAATVDAIRHADDRQRGFARDSDAEASAMVINRVTVEFDAYPTKLRNGSTGPRLQLRFGRRWWQRGYRPLRVNVTVVPAGQGGAGSVEVTASSGPEDEQ